MLELAINSILHLFLPLIPYTIGSVESFTQVAGPIALRSAAVPFVF